MTTPVDSAPPSYRFADLTLDVARRCLMRQRRPIVLKALDFDLLRFLVESAPHAVNADVLAENVWGRHFVSPENVAQRVMLLRQSLSDDANRPRYIETIRNKGYRLIPLVEKVPAGPGRSGTPPRAWLAAGVAALLLVAGVVAGTAYWPQPAAEGVAADKALAPPNSIAVLPFANLSSDPEQAYFADGLSLELVDKLVKIEPLLVTTYASSIASKLRTDDVAAIGRELGVRHVLQGSVRKAGNKLRIAVQLVDTATGFHVWSETYDVELGEMLAIQQEISRRVAGALQVTLGIGGDDFEPGGTENMDAYEHYLLARSLLRQNRQDAQARTELDQALALDPEFGLAQVALAQHLTQLTSNAWPWEVRDLADARDRAVERAVLIAPELPETYWVRAQQHMRRHEWGAAEQAVQKMWERSSPNDYEANANYGDFLRHTGYARESLPYAQRALLLDPLVAKPYVNLGFLYDALGDDDRAAATYVEMRTHVATLVGNDIMPHVFRVSARGNLAAARPILAENWQVFHTGPPVPRCEDVDENMGRPDIVLLCDARFALPRVRRAYAAAQADHAFSFATPGLLAAHFGDADLAVESFGKALLLDPVWLQFAWIPTLEPVRRHPRFKQVLLDMKLVDYWRDSERWPARCRPVGQHDFECF